MANPISVTYQAGASGAQTALAIDWRINPVSVSWFLSVPGGTTASVTIDHTYDNINDPSNPPITPVWISSGAVTATQEGAFTGPVQFIRVNISSLSGGPMTFKVLQGDRIN